MANVRTRSNGGLDRHDQRPACSQGAAWIGPHPCQHERRPQLPLARPSSVRGPRRINGGPDPAPTTSTGPSMQCRPTAGAPAGRPSQMEPSDRPAAKRSMVATRSRTLLLALAERGDVAHPDAARWSMPGWSRTRPEILGIPGGVPLTVENGGCAFPTAAGCDPRRFITAPGCFT